MAGVIDGREQRAKQGRLVGIMGLLHGACEFGYKELMCAAGVGRGCALCIAVANSWALFT